jgi:hypothetical protein
VFDVKKISISAAVGFALSFLISIVCTGKFFSAILRGGISAVIFAALYVGIGFIDKKFLSGSYRTAESSDETEKKSTVKKNRVDITIDDADLTEEEKAPVFSINSARNYSVSPVAASSAPEKTEEPEESAEEIQQVSETEAVPDEKDEKTEFVPVQVTELSHQDAEKSKKAPEARHEISEKKAAAMAEHAARVQEIDELPDIGAFADNENSGGSSGESEVISDSEFAQSGESFHESSSSGGATVNQDTKVIASAIRTLLKKDEM